MKTDIYQKMEKDFGSDLSVAIEQIYILEARTKDPVGERMLRAMVFLANGNLKVFKEVIELSQLDYRDVLWQAEYACKKEHLYDFNKTFHELKLL